MKQADPSRLRITEIFHSLQGEADAVGWPSVFVRLTGCPLRCTYCDSEYAFHGGQWWSLTDIQAEVDHHGARHVCITGGEPLAQPACAELCRQLCDAGYQVSIETSGAMDISVLDTRVVRVVDIKTPASGEQSKNRLENFALLQPTDQVKFVICDKDDYDWASQQLQEYQLAQRCQVLFSPAYQQVEPAHLADWILRDKLPVRFQFQLHKYLWGDQPGR